ncbi:hypothetical protein F4778DRAFT_738643 [Xylariomycetidae sp. FL2044]|nr:hypothetical protein F4778DRAFT_738643 [Xylariomycetidae sp. FL2044]
MTAVHDAFKALGPIDWDAINHDDLQTFLTDIFADAQCLIDSIPVAIPPSTQKIGRARSATESDLSSLPNRAPKSSDRAKNLRKEWKEVKVNPRENPLGLNVYKLSAKDGKGAWFSRRSVHEGLTFEKWKLGMEREFAESMKVQGKPGEGNIRGIGADKRVVNDTVEGCGKIQVYQLSAQFPGPTTPRDFVTLLLSSDSAIDALMDAGLGKPRYFMVVSKPCIHPECPPRQGFIRGQYESVEFIREMKIDKPLRKVRSSLDLGNAEAADVARTVTDNLGKEAAIRSARRAATPGMPSFDEDEGRKRGKTIAASSTQQDDDYETMIEWVMVTRSDPGGSVPRFMIERGTPAGIAGDADKFMRWVTRKSLNDFSESDEVEAEMKEETAQAEERANEKNIPAADPTSNLVKKPDPMPKSDSARESDQEDEQPGPSGLYGIIANALGVAASVAASHLPISFGSAKGGDTESEPSSPELSDAASSIHSFHSFEAEVDEDASAKPSEDTQLTSSGMHARADSTHSSISTGLQSANNATSQHEKDLKKLDDRRRKAEEKLQRAQERAREKKGQDAQGAENAVQKLREKHEREKAKQEEKYERELQKLEAKRANEQRKADQRRRKQVEKEERNNLTMELEKTRAERDLARKQIDILKEQVGELQSQNTMLVARLGKEGIKMDGAPATRPGSAGTGGGGLKRAATEAPNRDRVRSNVLGA